MGAGQFKDMRLAYYRGLVVAAIIFLVTMCCFIRLDLILAGMGFGEDISDIAWKAIICLIPYFAFQNYNENVRAYMMVLGFNNIFHVTNFIEIALGTFLGWLFIWQLGYGIYGVGISRVITEAFTCVILLITWKKYGMEESFHQGETFGQIFLNKKFWSYMKFWLSCLMPAYAEYLGFEVMTLYAGIYGDYTILSAWVCLQSVSATMYLLGTGFADNCRVFVGYQLGKKNFLFAKKIALWCFYLTILG